MGSNAEELTNEEAHGYSVKPAEEELAEDMTDPDLRLLRLFNHYRHDWMNDIQVLMAYIQLKKYDKVTLLMENIKEKVRQESFVAKLGVPSLILYLLSYQAEVKELRLEIVLQEEIHFQELKNPQPAASLLTRMLEAFKQEARASAGELGVLKLEMCRDETDGMLCLTLRYEGTYNVDRLKEWETAWNTELAYFGSVPLIACYEESKAVWTTRWSFTD